MCFWGGGADFLRSRLSVMATTWGKKHLCVVGVSLAIAVYFILHSAPSIIRLTSLPITPAPKPHSDVRVAVTEDTLNHTASPSEARSPHVNQFGYVLASSYFDQITGSMANFLSMQCWVGTLNSEVRVVEPFLLHSTFGLNISAMSESFVTYTDTDKNFTKLSDLFNVTEWTKFTDTAGYASMINWNIFVKDAPKKLILVDRECIPRDESYRKCDDCISLIESLKFNQSIIKFAETYSFEIVHKICIPEKLVTADEFRRFIYDTYDPKEVVVLFESWGGMQQNELDIRAPVTDITKCNRMNHYHYVPVSRNIVEDGKRYIVKYMPNALKNGYIAVMLRTQYLGIVNNFDHMSDEEIAATLNRCFQKIRNRVHGVQAQYKAWPVLMTFDCRKQGSYYFHNPQQSRIANIISHSVSELYQVLVGSSSTLTDWDNSFDEIASFKAAGYISILQKHLAALGTCLLMAGGGAFQSTTETMYSVYHHQQLPMKYCVVNFDITNGCR